METDARKSAEISATQLSGVWMWFWRGIWSGGTVLCLIYFIVVWTMELQQPRGDCLALNAYCNPIELSANDITAIEGSSFPIQWILKIDPVLTLAPNAAFLIAALLIFWRKSYDWVALLVSGTLMGLGAIGFSPDPPGLFAEMPIVDGFFTAIALACYVSPLGMLFFFPDGRFVPRWSRFIVLGLCVFTPLYLLEAMTAESPDGNPIFVAYSGTVGLSALIGIATVVYRYRRIANWQQKQQLKWVAFGLLSGIVIVLMWFFYAAFFPPENPSPARTFALLIGYLFLFPVMWLFPICIMIAVLRYQLFDIDVIIRRTLQYSILTALLALTYFGIVVLLQNLFFGDQSSEIIIVLSTLTIAALFNPLRRRVQDFIDRRFYRKKYNAEQALAQFATTARDEVDMDKLTAALIGVVQETMQPEMISL